MELLEFASNRHIDVIKTITNYVQNCIKISLSTQKTIDLYRKSTNVNSTAAELRITPKGEVINKVIFLQAM